MDTKTLSLAALLSLIVGCGSPADGAPIGADGGGGGDDGGGHGDGGGGPADGGVVAMPDGAVVPAEGGNPVNDTCTAAGGTCGGVEGCACKTGYTAVSFEIASCGGSGGDTCTRPCCIADLDGGADGGG